ncbi:hypothetical protein QOT17_004313 [Balamuthia mandrillaris]
MEEASPPPYPASLYEESMYILVSSPMWPVLTLAHALFVCYKLRPIFIGRPPLLSAVCCVMACLFGASLRYTLLGLPHPWLKSNVLIPGILVCWGLMNYSYSDIVHRLYGDSPFLELGLVLEMVFKGRAIIDGIELSLREIPDGIVAALVMGILSGTAGGFFSTLLHNVVAHDGMPSELSYPTFGLKGAVAATLFYYCTLDPHHVLLGPLMPANLCKAVVILSQVIGALNIHYSMIRSKRQALKAQKEAMEKQQQKAKEKKFE